jgi:uncharacterized membrane protein YfcA
MGDNDKAPEAVELLESGKDPRDLVLEGVDLDEKAYPEGDCGACLKFYFCEGQKLDEVAVKQDLDPNRPWFQRYRQQVAIGVPVALVWMVWFSFSFHFDRWDTFVEPIGNVHRYAMSITMVFGSMIAGATSEGGASVAFPVMTLGFGIKPEVARDFSFMIQTVGMNAAAFTIWFMKVRFSKHAVKWASLGGFFGMIFGLEVVAPALSPAVKKMSFVSVWFAFAASLYFLNKNFNRPVYLDVLDWNYYKALTLVAFGFLGGILSSVAGSGIDICTFACLTLIFRVTEKTATPTSVILMAINTSVGFFWRTVSPSFCRPFPMTDAEKAAALADMDLPNATDVTTTFAPGTFTKEVCGVHPQAWGFLYVCAPIVVVGAPFGSIMGSRFHRLVLASAVYITDTVQLIGAFVIVSGNYRDAGKDFYWLAVMSIVCILVGFGFFKWLTTLGLKNIKTWTAEGIVHPCGWAQRDLDEKLLPALRTYKDWLDDEKKKEAEQAKV